jgi:beta-phosphoglucomutase-like phosphatase (HAD superfamily)
MKHNFLILNIDKTIFDVVDPVNQAYTNLAQRYAIDMHPDFLKRVLDTRGSSRDRLDREFVHLAKLHPQATELYSLYIAEALAKDRLLSKKAATFLQFLADRAIPYGAVSSLSRRFVDQMIDTYPLFNPAFSIVQAEVFEGKPEPDLYLMAARKAGVHPNQVLAVESTLLGAEAAFLASVKVISINDESQPDLQDSAYSQQTFGDLRELTQYLKEAWPN